MSCRMDIHKVADLFERALLGDSDVSLPLYLDAYQQLNNLFSILGKGFSFVEKDLLEKQNILSSLQVADCAHYGTVDDMVSWECRSGAPSEKGSRTLLRLHRALLFIADFLKSLKDSHNGDQISTLCQTCYERTLSKHHNWLVRKCVGMATHLLASRDYLLSAIIKEGPRDEEDVLEAISRLVLVTEKVYARVQHIYESRNILDLS